MSDCVVDAFLVCSLSWYVLSSGPKDGDDQFVFPLAIKGDFDGLMPSYLASLYSWLDKCVQNVTKGIGQYDMVIHIDSSLRQIFMREDSSIGSGPLNRYPKI